MISLVTDNCALVLPKEEGFIETKILSNFYSYGVSYPFCLFWQGENQGKITSLICKFENTVFLSCNGYADYEELREFLDVIGNSSVQAEKENLNRLNFKKYKKYVCLLADEKTDTTDFGLCFSPSLKKVYDILFEKREVNLKQTDFEGWYADLSHRIRRERALAVTGDDISAAVVSHISDTSAVISGVAVTESRRKSGVGTRLINGVVKKLEGKKIYTATDRNTAKFYIKCGFKEITEIGVL